MFFIIRSKYCINDFEKKNSEIDAIQTILIQIVSKKTTFPN